MKRLTTLIAGAMAMAGALTANAWHLDGSFICPSGLAFSNVVVTVTGISCEGAFSGTAKSDGNGYFFLLLPECPGTYTASVNMNTLPPDAQIATFSQSTFSLDETNVAYSIYWSVNSSACQRGRCWLTGGGAKKDPLLDVPVGHHTGKGTAKQPSISFGGNINPGCSPTAGDGGDWNHVDRDAKLHFHGTSIQVVDCGNVTPPPAPGSTSPVTPFNFIEFTGTGTLKGIQGNKADFGTVYFFGRCEDRNEPGSNGANDGTLIDRYYLRVYTNPADPFGSTVLKLGGDDVNPANDVVPITDGNLQMHIKPCPGF